MLSDLTLQELELAKREVREKIKEIPKKYQISIGITDESEAGESSRQKHFSLSRSQNRT